MGNQHLREVGAPVQNSGATRSASRPPAKAAVDCAQNSAAAEVQAAPHGCDCARQGDLWLCQRRPPVDLSTCDLARRIRELGTDQLSDTPVTLLSKAVTR